MNAAVEWFVNLPDCCYGHWCFSRILFVSAASPH